MSRLQKLRVIPEEQYQILIQNTTKVNTENAPSHSESQSLPVPESKAESPEKPHTDPITPKVIAPSSLIKKRIGMNICPNLSLDL